MESFFPFVEWLNKIGVAGLIIAVLWGLLAILSKKIRTAYGMYLYGLSYLLGITNWLLCAFVLHDIWGALGLIVGILFLGVGVVPLCLIALMIHGQWLLWGSIIFSLILIFGSRFLGATIIGKKEEPHT